MKSRAGRAAFGAALLGVAALVGLLAWSGHRPAPLRRFVSLPLADGCRYTFVYPADARLMSVGPGSVVFFEGRDWGRSALVQFLLRNGLLSRGPHRLISVDTNNWNQGARNFRRAARTPPCPSSWTVLMFTTPVSIDAAGSPTTPRGRRPAHPPWTPGYATVSASWRRAKPRRASEKLS